MLGFSPLYPRTQLHGQIASAFPRILASHLLTITILAVAPSPLLAAETPGAEILFTVEQIDSDPLGSHTWRYSYWVTDFPFPAGYGFSILFDPFLCGPLDPPSPVNSDWDVLVLSPDPLLPDPGIYDALALVDAPSLSDPFTVSFQWLGEQPPHSQFFEVYDDSFQVIQSGTTAFAPEPPASLLHLVSLLTVATWKTRHFLRPPRSGLADIS